MSDTSNIIAETHATTAEQETQPYAQIEIFLKNLL